MTNFLTRSNLFDDVFRDLTSGFYVKPLHGEPLPRAIKLQVNENTDAYSVQAELPGVSKQDIDIQVDGSLVTIKAEVKQHDSQNSDDQILRSERYHGSVSRSFELPQSVDMEQTKAEFRDGVLLLTLPKITKKEVQKRVEIQ